MTGSGMNKNHEAIREMIDHRLKSVSAAETALLSPDSHLDEDTISAFVEGRLASGESQPILSHLTSCGACRRASAELVRLENQINAESAPEAIEEAPGRLQAFLANLTSTVSGGEEVVFAYQNPPADQEDKNAGEPESGPEPKKDKSG